MKIEWEWIQPHADKVNEIDKLAAAVNDAETFVFIGYSRNDEINYLDKNIGRIVSIWGDIEKPLIIFLITFARERGKRVFDKLQTHVIQGGKYRKIREQSALPWRVMGTKWEVDVE
jgi:hypothetical protein